MGLAALASNAAGKAEPIFDEVYSELPGEIAPRLAFALAVEQVRDFQRAAGLYDRIARTDPDYIGAIFGLARCRVALSDRNGAVEALNRVPASSSMHTCAQVEATRALMDRNFSPPGPAELKQVSNLIEAMTIDAVYRFQLSRQVLNTALQLITQRKIPQAAANVAILGSALRESDVRLGLEKCLREMARVAPLDEQIPLVEEANRVRPRTWT